MTTCTADSQKPEYVATFETRRQGLPNAWTMIQAAEEAVKLNRSNRFGRLLKLELVLRYN